MAAVHNLEVANITNQRAPAVDERVLSRSRNIPTTSETRQQASLDDRPIEISEFIGGAQQGQGRSKTFLYLAYGSNLCAETFLVKRKIKPLSQINVVVPQLTLTFDLAGIPYSEPCFANSRYRNADQSLEKQEDQDDYHKNRWHKGMVGVVYEVTAADYAHIIATEGGGSGYKDVVIDCHALDADPSLEVPIVPTTSPFKAHTLFSPVTARSRPDPAYAQPSARYKELITDGAQEHNLPYEYRTYLDGLRAYRITTVKQRFGQALLLMVWGPIAAFFFFVLGKLFLRKDGTYPKWYARFVNAIFGAVWTTYDRFFKVFFGDGERTIGDDTDLPVSSGGRAHDEKSALLPQERSDAYGLTNNAV